MWVDLFISLSFSQSGCIASKCLRSVVMHFRVFPLFIFVIAWKQIVNLYYSDCRTLKCWHRQSFWNGAGIKPRLEIEYLFIFDFICRVTLCLDLSRPNDQELLTTFDNKSYCLCSVIATSLIVFSFSLFDSSVTQVQPANKFFDFALVNIK